MITDTCKKVHIIKDNTRFLLLNTPISESECSLLMLKEWNNWERLSTAKHMVLPTQGILVPGEAGISN